MKTKVERNNRVLSCLGCGKIVKVSRYQVKDTYKCAKCRGNATKSKKEKRVS